MRPLIPKYEMLPPSDDSHRTPKHKAFTTASLTDRERQSGKGAVCPRKARAQAPPGRDWLSQGPRLTNGAVSGIGRIAQDAEVVGQRPEYEYSKREDRCDETDTFAHEGVVVRAALRRFGCFCDSSLLQTPLLLCINK